MTPPEGGLVPRRPPLRARWIAFRTLRHQVEPTGDTVDDFPVYRVGPARLVLPPGAHHFRRLRQCAICGREMTGRPVLAPSGLELGQDPHMCQSCSTGAAGIL